MKYHQRPRLSSSRNTTSLLFHLDHEHHVEMKHEISSKAKTTQVKLPDMSKVQEKRILANRQNEINEAPMKLIICKVLPLSLVDNIYIYIYICIFLTVPLPHLMQLLDVVCIGACCALLSLCSKN